MMVGVIIKKGLTDWQIVQQQEGKADIFLEGEWSWNSPLTEPVVAARVVDEETSLPVKPWTRLPTHASGTFGGTLAAVPAGGLYRVETCLMYSELEGDYVWGGRGDMRHHVGVGDVYLIAGQSNATGYAKDIALDSPELGVHLFRESGKWTLATHPLSDSTDSIFPANRDLANPGHSPYLHFAKCLKKVVGYPIGLVSTALGGSPLSEWNPAENGVLYRNLLAMACAQGTHGVSGVLWYQGCSDTRPVLCESYLDRFSSLIDAMRRDLNQPELPFFTVQLNRTILEGLGPEDDRSWGVVREAQRQAAHRIPGVYLTPANDGRLSDFVHNSASTNLTLGERLARQVLHHSHAGKLPCFAPEINSARKVAENQIELVFGNVAGRLYLFEGDSRFGRTPVSLRYCPFTAEDEAGVNPVLNFQTTGTDRILVTTARPVAERTRLHGAHQANPSDYLPMDSDSLLPMLSFYGVEVV
jgi:sialate O-acetylesterase